MKMIFSKFFKKKKWQSDKVSDRIVAVAELEATESENKSILHELAFNDGDDKVRRAALEKLNDFALYWQAFKKDPSESIRKLSEKIIIDSLTGKKDTGLDNKLKTEFIKECNKNQLLEKVVFELGDESLIKVAIDKIAKEQVYYKAIAESALSDTLKLELLANIDEAAQLKKLAKKLTGTLLSQVEEKLETQKLAAEAPVKLEKQLRLLLAQLNALKDKSDVALVDKSTLEIEKEWQQAELSILPESVNKELNQKYETISASLARILEPKKQQWLEEQKALELQQTQAVNFEELTQELTALEAQVTQSIIDEKELDNQVLTNKINQIEAKASQLELTKEHKAQIVSRAESLFNRANQLPLIKQAVEQAKTLLSQLKELSLPEDLPSLNEVNPSYKQVKNLWQDNLKQVDIAMPATLAEEFNQINDKWKPVIAELEKQQRQLFSQTRRKMTELESLINLGKFHSAFGLFKKLGYWMADLNDYQKNQLERKWQSLEEQIDNLHDLEKSFSNPKKQELLEDIKKLAEQPLVDPTEQAHRVRLLRSNWQSLGHADDEQEQALNNEFNELCEKAFAPCRDHYKELEDERQSNLDAKLLLVEQLESLASNLKSSEVTDWRSVESLYVKLTKLWRETGLIDREKVAEVNKRYHDATKPIKHSISAYHADNQKLKEDLIAQAEKIVASDEEVLAKTEQLKQLQNKWRQIGFAGRKDDQKLWNQFRAVNNPVFEQRDEAKKASQDEAKKQFTEVLEQLTNVEAKLKETDVLAEVKSLTDEAEQTFSNVKGLAKGDFEKVKRLNQSIKNLAENKIKQQRQQKEKQEFVDLFAAVENITQGKASDLTSLKSSWQTAINGNNKEDREEITIQIELTANIEVASDDKEKRNQVQMAMLSNKLENGVNYNLTDLLETWLAAGIFEDKDLALLNRIKAVYLN
jgi:hypothetical protein